MMFAYYKELPPVSKANAIRVTDWFYVWILKEKRGKLVETICKTIIINEVVLLRTSLIMPEISQTGDDWIFASRSVELFHLRADVLEERARLFYLINAFLYTNQLNVTVVCTIGTYTGRETQISHCFTY